MKLSLLGRGNRHASVAVQEPAAQEYGSEESADGSGDGYVSWKADPAPTGELAVAPSAAGVPRLGDMLLQRGAVTGERLTHALLEQTVSGRRLGEILVDQGIVTDAELAQVLADQLGLPVVDLRHAAPDEQTLAVVPELLAREYKVFPLAVQEGKLRVAVAGPLGEHAMTTLTQTAGMPVACEIAPTGEIERVINTYYDALGELDRYVTGFADVEEPTAAAPDALVVDDRAPIVQVVQRIMTQAVRERASDVHIEPQDDAVRVRFRVDGALHDVTRLPIGIAPALVSRLKIMADMNIVERRRSQDGQFEIEVDGRSLDVRVATTATIWGEKAVLRILDKSRSLLHLGRLGMADDTRADFAKLIHSPFGMVICAGPTGSGKTTTLYAALNEINDSERNVMTIEDPVEYVFPSINQIQINEQAGITFSGGLKAILRQDPDIILVGEVRDVETARIAVQSALTGHLVLSSLHATDSTAALHRLLDMGIEAFLVASSVIAIVAQRLVRRICTSCKEPYEPTPDELAAYQEWGGPPKAVFFHGAGCRFCAHTGYSDRVGVYELLHVSPRLRQLIVEHAGHDELREVAIAEGMRSLRDEAVRVINDDVTTIAEVIRSIYIA